MILLTLPVFFPIVPALDFGLPPDEVAIWFGILVLIVVGIGLTAPPIGLNVFVISSIAKTVPIASTYRGVLPFIVTDIVRLGLVVAFPGLALMARAPAELMRDMSNDPSTARSVKWPRRATGSRTSTSPTRNATRIMSPPMRSPSRSTMRASSCAPASRWSPKETLGGRRHVVIEFDSYATAKACHESPEYQAAAKIRDEASMAELVIIEGYEG